LRERTRGWRKKKERGCRNGRRRRERMGKWKGEEEEVGDVG
jgi:hypothetical protein